MQPRLGYHLPGLPQAFRALHFAKNLQAYGQSAKWYKTKLALPLSTPCYSTAQHSTAQHSTAQHSTAQHSTAQQKIDNDDVHLVEEARGGHGSCSLAGLQAVALPLLQNAAGALGQGAPPSLHLLLVCCQLLGNLALLVLQIQVQPE